MFSHGKRISIDSNRYQQGSDSNIRTAFVIKREVGIQCDIITCRNCSSLRKTFLDGKTGKKLYPNDFIGEDEELDQDVSALEMISIRHIRSMCNSHEPLKDFTVALDTVSNKDPAENPKRSNDLIDGLNINTGQPYENSTATASNKDHPTEITKRSNERKKSHLIDGLKIHTEQPYEDITATASNKDHPTKTRKRSNERNKSHLIDGLEINTRQPYDDITATASNKDHPTKHSKRSNERNKSHLKDRLEINTGQPYKDVTATTSNTDQPTKTPKRSNEEKKSHLIDGLEINTGQLYDITATASNKDHPTKNSKRSNERNKSHLKDGLEINTGQPYEDITATTSNEGHPTKTPKRSNERNKSHLIDGLEINTGQLYDITATASNKDHPTKNSKRSNERNKSHLKDGLEINTGQPYEDVTATTSNEGHPTKTPKRSNERNKSHLKDGLEINTGQPYEDVTATASNKDHPTKTPKKSNKRNKSHLIGGSKNNTGQPYEDITATTSNKGDEANGKMRNTRNLFININGPAKISLDTEKTNAPRERVSLKRSSAIDASSKEKGNSSVAGKIEEKSQSLTLELRFKKKLAVKKYLFQSPTYLPKLQSQTLEFRFEKNGDEAHEKMRDARNYSINISGPAKTSLDTVKTKAPRERVSLKRSSDSRLAFDASSEEKGSSSVPVPVKKARKEKTIVDSPRRFSTRQKKTPTRRFSMVMEVLTKSMRSRKFVKNKILNTGNVNIQSPRYKATKKINPRKSFHGYEVEKQPFMNTSLGSSDRSRRLYSPTEWLNSEESMIFAAKRSSSSSE